jgi:hypothetical protein
MSIYKDVVQNFLSDAVETFRNYKKLAERAIEQVSDEEFFAVLDGEANSIGVIVKHIAGNLVSRWSDLLTTDGEKPTRNRDSEFELTGDTRLSLMEFWDRGWQTLFNALESLSIDDLSRTITIRGQEHTVVEAIDRQLTHYAYHVGQIVLLAKHYRSADWKTLSVPRNRSAEFDRFLSERRSAGEPVDNRFDAPAEFTERSSK